MNYPNFSEIKWLGLPNLTDDKEQKGANCFLPFPFAWGLAVCVGSYKLVCRY